MDKQIKYETPLDLHFPNGHNLATVSFTATCRNIKQVKFAILDLDFLDFRVVNFFLHLDSTAFP